MIERNIRAYAWIHFAAATLTQTSMTQKATSSADTLLKDFDTRFNEDGEQVTPGLVEAAMAHFEDRVSTLEKRPDVTAQAIEDLRQDFDARFAGLREGVATELSAALDRLDAEDDESDEG